MSELTEIYICLNSEERGPFDSHRIDRMLQEGSLRLSDKAWRPGLPDWTTLEVALRPEEKPAEPAAPVTPATPKQKAFLSYMNIAFTPGLSKEQAALLVNEAMENPGDPARLAKWSEERLRLYPELYAADLQAKKENRPNAFYERVITEGKDCFHDVGKAHCQVLVGFLDVKYPNWDAREKEAAWDYFFPALAEKFPQLVNKSWRGRLQFQQGPRVAAEVKQSSALPVEDLPPLSTGSGFPSGKAFVVLALLILAGGGALYVKRNPEALNKLKSSLKSPAGGGSLSFESATPAPSPAAPKATKPAEMPRKETAAAPEPSGTAKAPEGEIAMTAPPAAAPMAGGDPDTKGSMSPAPAGSMAPAPAAESGSPPSLFTPPAASPPAGAQAPPAVAPPSGPRTSARITRALVVKTTYGQITIAPGTSLKILSREGAVVKVNYMNQLIAVPVAATDLEP